MKVARDLELDLCNNSQMIQFTVMTTMFTMPTSLYYQEKSSNTIRMKNRKLVILETYIKMLAYLRKHYRIIGKLRRLSNYKPQMNNIIDVFGGGHAKCCVVLYIIQSIKPLLFIHMD